MARDAKGRFLPGPDGDRHQFTRTEQRAGYARLMLLVRQGRLPSRVAASIRKRLTRYYQNGGGKYSEAI